jgi:RNA-binding protein Nova
MKMLVSNNAAGSIIGRQGQSISELQLESNTRIKFSQSNDFYPGTQDRVCLVQGSVPAVKLAIQLLIQRFYQIQQSENQHAYNTAPTMIPPSQWHPHASGAEHNVYRVGAPMTAAGGFDFVVRLLVPATCCGMIIGKSGANIKYMEEQTGVSSIRLSSKEESILLAPTNERIVTITGLTVEQCVQCVYIVLDGMMAHPDISHYTNMTTSYANCGMSMASTLLLGEAALRKPPPQMSQASQHGLYPMSSSASIMMQHHPRIDHVSQSHHQHHWGESMDANVFTAGNPGLTLSTGMYRRIASSPDLPRGSTTPGHHSASAVNAFASVGVNTAVSPPYSPLQQSHSQEPLPSASLIPSQAPFPMSSQSFQFQDPSAQETATINRERRHHVVYPQSGQLQPGVVAHSTSAPNLLAMQLEETLFVSPRHPETTPPSPTFPTSSNRAPVFTSLSEDYTASDVSTEATTAGAAAMALQMPTMIAPGCFTAQVLVPSTMVGSILGRGGRTLVDLQMMSGTNIRISQRNEYMPGTRSRIVTIRGPNAQSVWQAQYLISQRMTMVAPATTFSTVHSASAAQHSMSVAAAPSATAASFADVHHPALASSHFASRNEHSRLSSTVDSNPSVGTDAALEQEQQF